MSFATASRFLPLRKSSAIAYSRDLDFLKRAPATWPATAEPTENGIYQYDMPIQTRRSIMNGMERWMYKNHRNENLRTPARRYPSGRFITSAAPISIATLCVIG